MKKTDLEKAILDHNGNVSNVAKQFGVVRGTVLNYIDRYDLRPVLEEARDKRVDFVESALDNLIKEGNPAAIIFFLKTQGRKRGYNEQQDINLSGELKLPQIKWKDGISNNPDRDGNENS